MSHPAPVVAPRLEDMREQGAFRVCEDCRSEVAHVGTEPLVYCQRCFDRRMDPAIKTEAP